MAKRTPPPGSEPLPSLPHNHTREDGQPNAKEVDDYKIRRSGAARGAGRPGSEFQNYKGAHEEVTRGAYPPVCAVALAP